VPPFAEDPRIALVARQCLLLLAVFAIAGCGASKVGLIAAPKADAHRVQSLIVTPADGLFAQDNTMLAYAIGAELAKRGYTVVDTREATALLTKQNVNPADVLTPPGLATLRNGGIDAVLSVTSVGSPIGGSGMRNVAVTVNSTRTSGMIGGINWKNSWGGMPGSPADMVMRKGLNEAALEIAEALAKQLGPAGN
jgi:hypothetical protein